MNWVGKNVNYLTRALFRPPVHVLPEFPDVDLVAYGAEVHQVAREVAGVVGELVAAEEFLKKKDWVFKQIIVELKYYMDALNRMDILETALKKKMKYSDTLHLCWQSIELLATVLSSKQLLL